MTPERAERRRARDVLVWYVGRLMESAPPPPITNASAVPDWISEARRKYVLRIRDWLSQSWQVTVLPS